LEFLAENDIISRDQLNTILSQLPAATSFSGDRSSTPPPALPFRNGQSNDHNEKQANGYNPPPAYSNAPPPGPPILTHAVAIYAYKAADDGDLNLQINDRIAVLEYLNADWWKGRNERTGETGIFPQSYIRQEQRTVPPPPPENNNSSYGNMPMDVSQQQPQKGKSTLGKIGGKLGNAALFGAGGKFAFLI